MKPKAPKQYKQSKAKTLTDRLKRESREKTPTGRAKKEKTLGVRQLKRERKEVRISDQVIAWVEATRPKTRGECRGGLRPCPYVSCRHHLYLDVNEKTGSIKLNFPDKELWELEDTCVLDLTERGSLTLEQIGSFINLTRERVRQVEVSGLAKIKRTILTEYTDLYDQEEEERKEEEEKKEARTLRVDYSKPKEPENDENDENDEIKELKELKKETS